LRHMTKVATYDQGCDIWPRLWHMTKVVTYDQGCDIWPRLWHMTKVVTYDQGCDIWPSLKHMTEVGTDLSKVELCVLSFPLYTVHIHFLMQYSLNPFPSVESGCCQCLLIQVVDLHWLLVLFSVIWLCIDNYLVSFLYECACFSF
jgi:hypothetical protein